MINFGGTANRVEDAKLEFVFTNYTGDVILTGDSIAMGGLVWDSSTSVDGQFTIGGAVTGKLTINLFNDNDSLSIYDFRDSYLTAYLKMEGASDYTVMGQYFVGDFRYDGAMIALTAYDMLSKFDRPTSYLGNPAHTLTWPMPLKTMIQTACSICGVTLLHSTNPTPWDSYSITQKPQQWDSMTWHDVIAACAQISGTFAKIDAYGRLYFDWYDTSILSGTSEWDGGTFTGEAIPYADGDALDGGTFDPWNTGDAADGGAFGDRANVHVIPSAYSLTVDTDDVVITGLKVTLEASDNIVQGEGTQTYTTQLYGQDGYVITVSGNPFIETSANADAVKNFLGARVVGMMFRPLNASLIEDPTIEAGDVALIEGTNGNTYACFVSHVTYTTNAATIISCDAESTGISSKVRFSMSDKIRNETEQIQRDVQAVSTVAGNTNQYFWHKESGGDTGAHITQVPQTDFISNPEGGNLLARANGIAVRDGMQELAQFDADGVRVFDDDGNQTASFGDTATVGKLDDSHIVISGDGMSVYNKVPTECLHIGASDSSSTVRHLVQSLSLEGHTYGTGTITVSAQWPDLPSDMTTVDELRIEYSVGLHTGQSYRNTIRIPPDGNFHSMTFVVNQVTYTVQFKYENGAIVGSVGTLSREGTLYFQGTAYVALESALAPSFLYGTLASGGTIGAYSAGLGVDVSPSGDNSYAIGHGLVASNPDQVVVGRYNNNAYYNVFEVGCGTSDSGRKNAMSVTSWGELIVRDPGRSRLNLGIDCGYSQFEVGTQAYVTNTVTFNKTFSEPPIVVAGFFSSSTGAGMGRLSCGVFDVTTTDCKIRVWSYDSSNRSPRVNWIAVGT